MLTAIPCYQSESVLIQKIYTHFKKTPGTHKLGVLYVVDSVTRKWLEQAKSQGQEVNSAAQDGTYAAGVNRVTELMPVLMNDIFSTIPNDQKVRLSYSQSLVKTSLVGAVRPPTKSVDVLRIGRPHKRRDRDTACYASHALFSNSRNNSASYRRRLRSFLISGRRAKRFRSP